MLPATPPQVLSRELANSDSSSTPQTRRRLFAEDREKREGETGKEKEEEEGKGEEGEGEEEEGEVESPLKSIGNSKEPMVEGFESRPSSLVVSKEHADALQATLHMELSQQTTLPPGERAEKSHDSHVSSSQVSSSALSHLTNDILTYSAQVAMYPEKSESVSEATWLQSQDDGIRPTSPTAVSRVFKVVFLGERKEGMGGRRKEGRGKGVGRGRGEKGRGWRRRGGGMEEGRGEGGRGDGGGRGEKGKRGRRRGGGEVERLQLGDDLRHVHTPPGMYCMSFLSV